MSTRLRVLLSVATALVLCAGTSMSVQGQEGGGGGGRGGAVDGPPIPPRNQFAPVPGGPIPRRADGKPDLSGYWTPVTTAGLTNTVILEEHPGGFGITAGHSLIIDPADGKIPYQPWALAERDRRRDDANGYEDPVGHCEYYDIGRVQMFVQEIMYSGNYIILNVTQHITRVVDMTRKTHLPANIKLWNGDPIGHWEGDTLVVESTNFTGRTRMAIGGDFYSPGAKITERWTPVDANQLRWTLTVDDPAVFTRPWTMTSAQNPMRRLNGQRPDFDGEDTCNEGNTDLFHLRGTFEQAHGAGKPWVVVKP